MSSGDTASLHSGKSYLPFFCDACFSCLESSHSTPELLTRQRGGGGSKTKKQEFIAKWVVFMKSHLFIMAVSCSLEQGSKKKEQSPEIVQAVIISIICQT